MRKRIVIRLAEIDAAYEASWLVFDHAQGEQPAVIKTGSLAEAATACEGIQATVLVPASTVLLAEVAMPTSNQRRILSAVPYALEDQLAEDVEGQHFCIGKRNEQGLVPTAVVAHWQMQHWQAQLKALGIQVDLMISEVFALPIETDSWSLLLEDHAVVLRTGNDTGYSADADNRDVLLLLAVEAAGEHLPQRLDVYDARVSDRSEVVCESLEVKMHVLHEPAISIMADALPTPGFSLNLLQGEYSRKEQLGKIWRPWIPAAGLAATLFVVSLAVVLTESIRMENKAERLQKQIESLYLEAFPGARAQTALGTIEFETKRRLKNLRGGEGGDSGGFLELLSLAGEQFSQTQGLVLGRMSYRAGKLDVALRIGDLQKLDTLKQRLMETKQLNVDIQSASWSNGKVEARLQIERSEA